MTPRQLGVSFALIATLVASSIAAQDAPADDGWKRPLEGMSKTLFAGRTGVGVLLVTPVDDDDTRRVEQFLREQMLASDLVELVMDDSPLGDLSGKSDDEIIAMTRKYPVDFVLVLRTFPGGDDGPTAVLRIETTEAGEAQSFRFRAGQQPPWMSRPRPVAPEPENSGVIAAAEAAGSARHEAAMTKMGAIGVAETLRLVAAERSRRVLAFEPHPRSPVVRNPGGDVVPWPRAYEAMDRIDLGQRYRRRKVTRTAAIATGGVLAVAGVGLLFVGLANQANCGSAPGCGRPTLLVGGFSSLGLGAIAAATGLALRPHPIATNQVEQMVERHNQDLE